MAARRQVDGGALACDRRALAVDGCGSASRRPGWAAATLLGCPLQALHALLTRAIEMAGGFGGRGGSAWPRLALDGPAGHCRPGLAGPHSAPAGGWRQLGGGARGWLEFLTVPWWCFVRCRAPCWRCLQRWRVLDSAMSTSGRQA
jgi:hypothetical protein